MDVLQIADLLPALEFAVVKQIIDEMLECLVRIQRPVDAAGTLAFAELVEILEVVLSPMLDRVFVLLAVDDVKVLEVLRELDHMDVAVNLVRAQRELPC